MIKTNFFDGQSYLPQDLVNEKVSLLTDGVFSVSGGAFLVSANSPADLSVNVASGAAIKNGYFVNSDAAVNVPIMANTSGYNRIDIIVLEVDTTNKVTSVKAVQGTPSSSPTAPLPASNQLVLAQVYVGNNVSVINTSNITDVRIDVDLFGGQFALRPIPTQADITYYVDGTNGNDSNAGLASGTSAFKTIGKAISLIPQIVNHDITINIAAATYNETISLSGYTGKGKIFIVGDSVASTSRKVNNIRIVNNSIFFNVKGLDFISQIDRPIYITTTFYVYMALNMLNGNTTYDGIYVQCSHLYVEQTTINNAKNAIYAANDSNVLAVTLSGSGNTTVFYTMEGKIMTSGTAPSGTTYNTNITGGRLISASPRSNLSTTNGYKVYEDGAIEEWFIFTTDSLTANTPKNWSITVPLTFLNEIENVQLTDNGNSAGALLSGMSYVITNLSTITIRLNCASAFAWAQIAISIKGR